MFWQDLRQRLDKFFKYFEEKRDSRVVLVINVDLRSNVVSVVIFGVVKYFWNPLSFTLWHLANFNVRRLFK